MSIELLISLLLSVAAWQALGYSLRPMRPPSSVQLTSLRPSGMGVSESVQRPALFNKINLGLKMVSTDATKIGSTIPQGEREMLAQHEKLVQGKLDNGLTYIVLPNKVPEGRFEAHLEVLSGSAHELEAQQVRLHCLCGFLRSLCSGCHFAGIG